jgi:hypothetical protein
MPEPALAVGNRTNLRLRGRACRCPDRVARMELRQVLSLPAIEPPDRYGYSFNGA